jgi:hypothetical protein
MDERLFGFDDAAAAIVGLKDGEKISNSSV